MKTGKILLALSLALFAVAFVIWFIGDAPAAPVETQPVTESVPETSVPVIRWEDNVLMNGSADYHDYLYLDWSDDVDQGLVFGSKYQRRNIYSVTFLTDLDEAPEDAWDVSGAQDGSVMAWVKPIEEMGGQVFGPELGEQWELYDLYIAGENGVNAGESCARLFAGYVNLQRVDLGGLHLEQTRDLSGMFFGCHGLTELELGGCDTSAAEDMRGMFAFCTSLQEIPVSGLDTANVRSMENMFTGCEGLKVLDLTALDVGRVESMYGMFDRCVSLEDLDLSGLNTGRVRNMASMFENCYMLRHLDLEGIDTRYVDNMASMFQNCASLRRLDLSSLDTSLVTLMNNMFQGCTSLTELDLSSFDTGNVTGMGHMFMDCASLKTLDLSHFDMGNVSGEYCTYKMFYNCPAGADWQHLLK